MIKSLAIKTIDQLAERIGYTTKELQVIANSKKRFYRVKEKIDKKGKIRVLYISVGPLRKVLDLIKTKVLNGAEFPECMHGYRKRRDYKSNAKMHVGKNLVCNLDIKDFFPSIHHGRVHTTFIHLGCSEKVTKLLTWLVTCDNHLPHGFPTSPVLSNLVVSNLARRLQGIGDRYKLTLTMYSDNISISGNIEEIKFRNLLDTKLLPIIRDVVEREGFNLNPNKLTIAGRKERQITTGLTVNKKTNIRKEKRREILSLIRELQKGDTYFDSYSDALKAKQSLRGKIANTQNINPPFAKYLLHEFQEINWSRLSLISNN